METIKEKEFLNMLKCHIKRAHCVGCFMDKGMDKDEMIRIMNQDLLYLKNLVREIEEYENKI